MAATKRMVDIKPSNFRITSEDQSSVIGDKKDDSELREGTGRYG